MDGQYFKTGLISLILFFLGKIVLAQTLTSDRMDYPPGDTAIFTGQGFQSGENIAMRVLHYDGTPDGGEDHEIWQIVADSNGNFVTTWHVCEDDCAGSTLMATADGVSSLLHAEVIFTDAATINITSNPASVSSALAICAGTSVTFTATFACSPGNVISYAWKIGGVTQVTNTVNATSNNWTTSSLANGNVVSCTITFNNSGPCNGSPVTTGSITVTVANSPPSIITQPLNQSACAGSNTSFSVSGGGLGLKYQWQDNSSGSFANISGATSSTLNLSSVSASMNGRQYQCVISNPCGSVTSDIAVLSIPSVSAIPLTQTICSGGSISMIDITSTTGSFIWTANYPSGTSGSMGASGTNDINGNITNSSSSIKTVSYSITTSSPTCSGSAITANVNVNPVPTVNTGPLGSMYFCNGISGGTAVNFNGTATSFSWTNDNTAIGLAAGGTGNIPTFTPVNSGTSPVVANITVTPHSISGVTDCIGTPANFSMTVNPNGQVNQPSNFTVCNGASASAVNFSTVNSGGTTTYAWINNNTSIGLPAAGNGDISPFPAINTGSSPVTAIITVTPTFSFGTKQCAGTAATFTITVNPTPVVIDPADQVVCNNSLTSAVTFSGVATSYNWTNDETSIGLAASGSGNIPAFTAVNAGTSPLVSTITITPHYNNGGLDCIGIPVSFTITVNPNGQVNQPSSQVVCNNTSTSAINFGTVNSVGSTTYDWANNNTNIGLAATGIGNIAAFTAANTGTSPLTSIINVTPTFSYGSKQCAGTAATFTITVNPTPVVIDPSDQVVCNNSLTSAVTFSGVATSYNWTNDETSIGLAASGSGNIPAFTAVNAGTSPLVSTITITPHYNNGGLDCIGIPVSFTITVNPNGQVNQPSSQVVCNNTSTSAINFGTMNSVGSTTYDWTNTNTNIGLAATGTGNIAAFTAANTGTSPLTSIINVIPTFSFGSTQCVGTAATFTITVNPTPAANDPADQSVCNNTSTAAIVFGGVENTYSWTNDKTSIGLAASGNGNIDPFTVLNSGATPVIATIIVTPHFTNAGLTCDGPTQTFTITAKPTPLLTSSLSPPAICSNNLFNYTPTSGTPGTVFSWTRAAVAGISNAAGNGTGDPNEVLVNSTGAAINVTYVYSLTADGCSNPLNYNVVVVVNANPAVTSNPSDALKCIGESASFSASAIGTGISYQWYKEGSVSGLANISGKISGVTTNTLTISNITVADAGNYYVVVSGTCTPSATSTSAHLMVKEVAVVPTSGQYSDLVKFTGKIYNGKVLLVANPTAAVTFKISDINVNGAVNIPMIVNGGTDDLIAEITKPLVEVPTNPSNLQMSPGNKTVKACFNNISSPASACNATTTLTILREDDPVFYTGGEFASTGTETAVIANIRLSATVKDTIDGNPGDIRNARVRFKIQPYNCDPSMTPQAIVYTSWRNVSLINLADLTIGTAVFDTAFNIGSCNAKIFDITVEVSGYYVGYSSVVTITVAKTLADFITGGGHMDLGAGTANKSYGPYRSSDNSKINFGFNVKYNKNKTNLQGNVNIIIRSAGKVYQVKGIVGGTNGALAVNVTDPNNKKATVTSKASMIDVATGLAVNYGSNATMELKMSDKAEPGANIDTYGVTIWGSNNSILYSNYWTGSSTNEVAINGGNIQVSNAVSRSMEENDENGSDTLQSGISTLANSGPYVVKVFPNPTDQSRIVVSILGYEKGNKPVQLFVYDVTGKLMHYDSKFCLSDCKETVLDLDEHYSAGTYIIDVVIEDKGYIQKLVVHDIGK